MRGRVGQQLQGASRIEFAQILKAPLGLLFMQLSSTQKSLYFCCAVVLLLGAVLWWLAPVLAPFVVATVLAYALTPLVDRITRWGRGRIARSVVVVVVECLFLLGLLGVVLLVVPILSKELPLMRDQLPLLLTKADATLRPWLAQWGVRVAFDPSSVQAFVKTYLSANVEDALGSLLTSLKLGGSVAFAIVGNVILIPVVLFYLLKEWHRLVDHVRNWVPLRLRPVTDSFVGEADAVLGQYLRGQIMVMLALAVFYSVGLALFGLDLALPIGVFTGLAVFIPYLGFGLGLLLASFAGLLQFASHGLAYTATMLLVVYGAGQLLESFLLTPKLVGERIGLHPLAVIFVLLAFGQLFGFVGVLVALPVSAVLLVLVRRLRASYVASALYRA